MKGYVTYSELKDCSIAELKRQKKRHDLKNLEDWEKTRIDEINRIIKGRQTTKST